MKQPSLVDIVLLKRAEEQSRAELLTPRCCICSDTIRDDSTVGWCNECKSTLRGLYEQVRQA